MQTWEEKVLDRERGKTEGRIEGRAEALISILEELGSIPDELREEILSQQDLKVLDQWLKLAVRASNMEMFRKQIGK